MVDVRRTSTAAALLLATAAPGCRHPADVSAPPQAAPATASRDLALPQERHLRNVRQLTFGGENAEAYFSFDGKELVFQATPAGAACDQEFIMRAADGSGVRRVSTGEGRVTCGYFFPDGARILYASTHAESPACPPKPDDAWTLHQLGLLAERRGDRAKADALLAKARRLAPDEFRADLPVDAEAFRGEVSRAVETLPEDERRSLAAVPIEIQDLPDAEDLLAVEPPLSPSILGLFRGPSEDEPCTAADGPRCRAIVFYRKNLLRFARDRAELVEQVRVTLLHELGHLHGEDDDELRARGLE